MKFSTNTLYGLSASLFVVGIVGALAWTKGEENDEYVFIATKPYD